jgi:undecaprenyl-diphosphatase
MSYGDAFIIGLVQCFAMVPGVSRSAATIAGALSRKMDRVAATEFSFFLAVPTLMAAGCYKLLKNWDSLSADQVSDLAIGNVVSFAVAIVGIKLLINVVKNKSLAWFGVYRIVAGVLFLAYLYFN